MLSALLKKIAFNFSGNKKKELVKLISVYISDKHKQLILAPVYYKSKGLSYEQEKCFVADYPVNLNDLGTEVINNLNLTSFKDKDLRNLKATEWPAFKHSKSKSVRAFEEDYIQITIRSLNSSNIILEIKGKPYKNADLAVSSDISFHTGNEILGQKLISVYESCLIGKLFL